MGQDPTKGGLILNLDGFSGEGARTGGSSEVGTYGHVWLSLSLTKMAKDDESSAFCLSACFRTALFLAV